jgi:hypothetical protein
MKPNGRDYKTDPVLKRLADSDHATLIFARRLQALQIPDVHDADDGTQGPISDVIASQAAPNDTAAVPVFSTGSASPPTEGQQESTATPAIGRNVENAVLRRSRYRGDLDDDDQDGDDQDGDDQDDDEVYLTIK